MDAVLIRRRQWRIHAEKAGITRSHTHTLRRLFEDQALAVDGILCLDRRPTLCVLNAHTLDNTQIERIRRRLWNLGATTLLLVETQRDIRLFSTLVKPSRTDEHGNEASLTNEIITNLRSAALAQRLTQLIRRVETGAIYRDYASRFDPAQAVDRELLDNLKATRDVICPETTQLQLQHAHRLIGRFLFSCYLLDRGIVGPRYLAAKNLPPTTDMQGLLSASPTPARALEQLFTALHRDFNGSLFGEPFSEGSIRDTDVTVLRRLLAGENLRTGQLALPFKLYDFSYVPVELISSIYEEFLGAEAAVTAQPAGLNQPRRNAQRASGAYYTPPRLAELTVDIATEGWETLLDKRCLDPACGSGIFLVILFVRMAEEWRLRNPKKATIAKERYQGLLGLLENNLHGVDIQLTACLVTCFSLYLAFLDQMEPKEIHELREELERAVNAKILPRILWEAGQDKPRIRDRHYPTVREFDFFAMETDSRFHLVVGNPPWVSRKSAPHVEAWLYSERNPYAPELGWRKHLEKQPQTVVSALFPAREQACAFMWKSSLHTLPNGRVCQVMPSRVFLSNNTDAFQAAWFSRHKMESVWLLADHRFVLFPTADCPCFIGRHHALAEGENIGEFEFVSPKVELSDPRAASLPVQPEDQKTLSQPAIISAAKEHKAALLWKEHHWGTPRDLRLLERLLRWPRLSRIAVRPPGDDDIDDDELESSDDNTSNEPPPRIWYKGQGFQPNTASTTKPKPVFWKQKDRLLSAKADLNDLILLHEQTKPIGTLHAEAGLHRTRNPLLYRAPMLIVNKACTKFLFSDFDVLFQDDFQSICAPIADKEELLFLTAYFASPLAQYLLFHTTANIGIERDIARLNEMLRLPFPLPEDMPDPAKARCIIHESAVCLLKLQKELRDGKNLLCRDVLVDRVREELYSKVSDYFGLCEWERDLIADTVEVFRPSSTPGSFNSDKLFTAQPSKFEHRKAYADTLMRTFQTWTRRNKPFWVRGHIASASGLSLLTFGTGGQAGEYMEVNMPAEVERITRAICDSSAHEDGTLFRKLRGFAYYETDRVHLLKPLARRHWTRAAALNDADDILSRMMEEGGWGA